MPTYDFTCENCRNSFEIFCKIAELDDPHVCPECGSAKVCQRFFSPVSTIDSFRLSGVNKKRTEFKDVLNRIHRTTPGSVLDKTTNL